MVTKNSIRDQNAEATRRSLIDQARILFAKEGFSRTSLSKIAEQAHVSKGAIYHHFSSKEDMFSACYSSQARDVANSVKKISLTNDPWKDTIRQCEAFLNTSMKERAMGLSIQEAITVLGWEKWRKLDEEHTMGLLTQAIARLQEAQLLKPYSRSLLADAIYGILVHAMMSLVGVENKATARDELLLLIQDLIQGIMSESGKEMLSKP